MPTRDPNWEGQSLEAAISGVIVILGGAVITSVFAARAQVGATVIGVLLMLTGAGLLFFARWARGRR